MLVLKVFLIVALIKILLITDQPFLCSGLYAGVMLLLVLAFGAPLAAALLVALIGFVGASIYFWLLSRFEDSGLIWWLILIAGLVVGAFPA